MQTEQPTSAREQTSRAALCVDWGSVCIVLGVAAWGLCYVLTIPDDGGRSSFLPAKLLTALLVCGIFVLRESARTPSAAAQASSTDKEAPPQFFIPPRMVLLGSFVLFITLIPWLGFVLSGSLFMLGACTGLGYRNIPILVALTAGMVGFSAWLFLKLLMIPIPIWPDDLIRLITG